MSTPVALRSAPRSDLRRGLVGSAALALVLVVSSVSCVIGSSQAGWPRRPATLSVGMEDFAFALDRSAVPAGRIVFDVTNQGQEPHQLILLRLPEDGPPLARMLEGPGRTGLPPAAVLPPQRPGATRRAAYDLAPGRYGLICVLRGEDGEAHTSKGMHAEFQVDI